MRFGCIFHIDEEWWADFGFATAADAFRAFPTAISAQHIPGRGNVYSALSQTETRRAAAFEKEALPLPSEERRYVDRDAAAMKEFGIVECIGAIDTDVRGTVTGSPASAVASEQAALDLLGDSPRAVRGPGANDPSRWGPPAQVTDLPHGPPPPAAPPCPTFRPGPPGSRVSIGPKIDMLPENTLAQINKAPPGAWICAQCGNLNFQMRQACNAASCRRPRGRTPAIDGSPAQAPPGGWPAHALDQPGPLATAPAPTGLQTSGRFDDAAEGNHRAWADSAPRTANSAEPGGQKIDEIREERLARERTEVAGPHVAPSSNHRPEPPTDPAGPSLAAAAEGDDMEICTSSDDEAADPGEAAVVIYSGVLSIISPPEKPRFTPTFTK